MTVDAPMNPAQQAAYDEWKSNGPTLEELIEQDRRDVRNDTLLRLELNTLRARAKARELLRAEEEQVDSNAFDDQYLDGDQLDNLPTPDPIIDGVLSRHAYAVLRGRDATFKTFVALDWALCVASGKPWQGRQVEQGRVLYIAGEGAHGIAARVEAWKYAWRSKLDPERFTLRQSAVNFYRGGAALADLIARVEAGEYTLVVVDTLRRASGGAEGNGSDMGVVVDNLERVRRATADGALLALAHTDKGDNDTRGFSGIEDDADIVWHAKRDDDRHALAVDLKLTKMKDSPDGTLINLTMQSALGSLVVSTGGQPDEGDVLDTDRKVLDAMRDYFAQTGATVSQLAEVTGMTSSTLYKVRGRLLDTPWVTLVKRGGGTYLELAPDVGSPWNQVWNPTPDSTPDSTPVAAGLHAVAEHVSTPLHASSTPDSTPFHTRPRVFRHGERGESGEKPGGEAS